MRLVSFRLLILYLILGALIGSLLGELIGWILPEGVVKDFFLRHIDVGIDPTTIDLKLITFSFGFSLTLNIAGLFGILFAVYLLRWYR